MASDKRLFCVLCLCMAASLFAAEKPKKTEPPRFVPGEEVRIKTDSKDISGGHFVVYVPSDYTDEQDWPVIFCFHGQSGEPTTWPFRQAADGKGFVVVGMGYVPHGKGKMTRKQYTEYLKRERKSILEVRKYVSEHMSVDRSRLFIGGYSKGGWHSSVILECTAKSWAGAVIFAAGRSRNADAVTSVADKRVLRGKPIYIGAGENDVNITAAKKALKYYQGLGAKVTFEEVKGEGHSFAATKSEIFRNWLIANVSA